jgi:predicted alpha/beta hydrolase
MTKIINGAIARIVLRYGVGAVIGAQAAGVLAGDADVVLIVAAGVGALTEGAYAMAKRRGWVT